MKTRQHPISRSRLATCSILAALLIPAQGSADETAYEEPPTLSAAALAPDHLLSGPHHRVDDAVPTDGFLAHYAIESAAGALSAVGPGRLEARIREIEATAVLHELEQSDELKSGAKRSAAQTAAGIRHFVDEPEETIKGIPEGVGRFLKRSYRSAKTGVQTLRDAREGRVPGIPEESGPGSNLPGGAQELPQPPAGSQLYKEAARAAGNAAVDVLGYEENRRHLARRLGVDPYTTNPVLARKLDEVAWSAFAGNLGMDVVTSLVPGGTLARTSTVLSEWVWETHPGDLQVPFEQSLLGMGVEPRSVDLLRRLLWCPLSVQAALVSALRELEGVSGRADIMPLALTVASEEQARFLVDSLRMTARYHQTVKPLQALVVRGTVAAIADDGELVVAAPADVLSWTAAVDRFTGQEGFSVPTRSLHLAGRATASARSELEARGWSLHEDSILFIPMIAPAAPGG